MSIDFKYLGKKLTKFGLWGKPLDQFDSADIMALTFCLQGAQLNTDRHCGTCWYQGWKGLKTCCTHPEHPVLIPVWLWALADCKEWSKWDDKELPTHPLNRVERVSLDDIKEGGDGARLQPSVNMR